MLQELKRFFVSADQYTPITELLSKKIKVADGADSTVYQSGDLALHVYKPRIKLYHLELLQQITQRSAEVAKKLKYTWRNNTFYVRVVTIDSVKVSENAYVSVCRFIPFPHVESIIEYQPFQPTIEELLDRIGEDLELATGYKYIDIIPMNVRYNKDKNTLWITDLYSGVLNLQYYFQGR